MCILKSDFQNFEFIFFSKDFKIMSLIYNFLNKIDLVELEKGIVKNSNLILIGKTLMVGNAISCFSHKLFSQTQPSGPGWSKSSHVHLNVCLSLKL